MWVSRDCLLKFDLGVVQSFCFINLMEMEMEKLLREMVIIGVATVLFSIQRLRGLQMFSVRLE